MEQFWDATPRELINAYRGKFREEERKEKEAWERMRIQTAVLIQPHTKKGQKVGVKDIIKLPWDAQAVRQRTAKEKAEALKRL